MGVNSASEVWFFELEQGIYSALETYSNVHRGSGHNSIVTTHLYEKARDIILDYLGLKKGKYTVIFCTPRRADILVKQIKPGSYNIVSSRDIGLPLGVCALAVKRKNLPGGTPFHTGGGTTRLISQRWVIWAHSPDRFEAGTPAIINVVEFAQALRMIRKSGNDIFKDTSTEKTSAAEILHKDELNDLTGQELLDNLKLTLLGNTIQVPTLGGDKPFTNLDNSASTRTFRPVWNAYRQTCRQSVLVQQEIIDEVRSICASFLGAPSTSYDVIFTSNTTEAINLVAESQNLEIDQDTDPVVINTLMEHSSNDLPWRMISNSLLIRLSVDSEGFIDLNELETNLSNYNQKGLFENKRVRLVAISGASNVLGSCSNISEISQMAHKYGALLMVDAAQLIAHRKIDMESSGIDYLAFSAHKIYAPFGCGALVARKGLLQFGSEEMETILLSGNENAAGIAALGKALLLLQRIGMDLIREEEQSLTRKLLNGLTQIPEIKIYGIKDPDSPLFSQKLGVVSFTVEGLMSDKVAGELTMRSGIGVRFGCHCAHMIVKHVLNVGPGLERFQRIIQKLFPKISFPGLTRVSLGLENSEEDVDRLTDTLEAISRQARVSSASKAQIQKKINDYVEELSQRVYT